MTSPRVLVSILNYNAYENAIETVDCFLRQDYANFDLQVIDNSSTDGSAARLRERFPALAVVELPVNLGYVGGNNHALEMALAGGYDYVLVSNEDIAIDRSVLSRLVETALAHPRAGVIGGVEVSYYTDEVKAAGGVGFNAWLGRSRWLTHEDIGPDDPVDYVQGACVMVARAAMASGVRFDPRLFMYLDEVDVGLQLKLRGLTAVVDPRCRIRHKARPALFDPRSGYLIQRNRLYLVRKHGSWAALLVNIVYLAVVELPIKSVLRLAQGHREFTRACIDGFIDGLRGHMGAGRVLSIQRKWIGIA